jgi:hypothetical protein
MSADPIGRRTTYTLPDITRHDRARYVREARRRRAEEFDRVFRRLGRFTLRLLGRPAGPRQAEDVTAQGGSLRLA